MRLWLVPAAAALAAVATVSPLAAQTLTHAPRAAGAAVRVDTPPTIDGRLGDEAWAGVGAADRFTQQDPDEGQPATERTELRVVYDDEALYIAARMFDREATLISRRLANRDANDNDADTIDIYLDSMHDHQTGAKFQISAAGVQHDAILFNDTWNDRNWDSVWYSAVSVDDAGWSAE